MRSIEGMLGGIRVVESAAVANSVFNYVRVVVQSEEEEKGTEGGEGKEGEK